MPHVEIHPIEDGIIVRKKTMTGKTSARPDAIGGESLRRLTWLTAADVKFLTLG